MACSRQASTATVITRTVIAPYALGRRSFREYLRRQVFNEKKYAPRNANASGSESAVKRLVSGAPDDAAGEYSAMVQPNAMVTVETRMGHSRWVAFTVVVCSLGA